MKKNPYIALILALSFVLASLQPALAADPSDRQVRRQIALKKGKSAELFIGNGGVFMDESLYTGTLVLTSIEGPSRGWHVFTQRTLDIRVLDADDEEVDQVLGLVRVFFNLTHTQRVRWNDESSNMSIWHRPQGTGWQKCVTHLIEESGFPHGRLYCLVKSYGLYGLAYTKPTITMKLEKANN